MGLRKRFLVVVVGVAGSPAEAQRSEIGRFRSKSAAHDAGCDEWRRILFVHAPHVDRYRIVIEDDGVEVDEVPMPELPPDAGPGILDETVTPLGATIGALGEPIEPEPEPEPEAESEPEPAAEPEPEPEAESEPEPAAEPEPEPEAEPEAIEATGELAAIRDDLEATGEHEGMADEVAVTGEQARIEEEDEEKERGAEHPPPRPYISIDDPPEGPVPEEIIQRFAEMVRAEEERAAGRSARDHDRGG